MGTRLYLSVSVTKSTNVTPGSANVQIEGTASVIGAKNILGVTGQFASSVSDPVEGDEFIQDDGCRYIYQEGIWILAPSDVSVSNVLGDIYQISI